LFLVSIRLFSQGPIGGGKMYKITVPLILEWITGRSMRQFEVG